MGADKFTDTDFAHWRIEPAPGAAPDPETLALAMLEAAARAGSDAEARAAIERIRAATGQGG